MDFDAEDRQDRAISIVGETAMYRQTHAKILGAAACLALASCGGSRILKEPVEFTPPAPLVSGADANLHVDLVWVVVRDGPGTWARNADWDEYLLTVSNLSDESLRITAISVYDSLGRQISADEDRKSLVKASRETSRRYKGQGVEVKAGVSGGTLLMASAASLYTAASVGAAAIYAPSALAVGAVGALVLAPVLAVVGVVKMSNNNRVAKEIGRRHTALPAEIFAGNRQTLDLFFSLGPSPQRVELIYVDGDGEHSLNIDTRAALAGLHIPK